MEFCDEAIIICFGGSVAGTSPTPERRPCTTVMLAHEVVEKDDFHHFMLHSVMVVEGAIPTRTRCRPTTVMLAHASIQRMQ
jgi:hypothetical protein